jgi:2-amino-4-hydroxy-6-hydroxymethyldihydropteridine diphosphokinase
VSDQPWFNNAVILASTDRLATETLAALHKVEAVFGRVRTVRNAARVLDLDLLDFGGEIVAEEGMSIPHPRLHERAFVLLPLRDVAPDYRHPVTGATIDHLIDSLPSGQQIRPVAGAAAG